MHTEEEDTDLLSATVKTRPARVAVTENLCRGTVCTLHSATRWREIWTGGEMTGEMDGGRDGGRDGRGERWRERWTGGEMAGEMDGGRDDGRDGEIDGGER